jgi:PAS domain S-box-containing protein
MAWERQGSAGEPAEEFLDLAPCGLLSTTPDGKILTVNRTFLAWTGYERGSLVGVRRLDELFTIPCRIYYETHYAPLLRMQGFVSEIAIDIVRHDGRILPAFLNTVEKRDADGSALLLRTAVFDGSDRRKYERELLLARRNSEEAVKAKAAFLAMFAHEIRNPLGAIMLQAELLEREGLAQEYQKALSRMRASLEKVLGLLNNMLDISRLEAGKVTLEETDFDLAHVIQTVVHTLAPVAERKGIPVHVRVDSTLPKRVRGDPVKLDQALTNLVGNAIKFTEMGEVTIGADLLGASGEFVSIRFWVRDTGIGIPAEQQELIFEEYEQATPTVARRFGGSGLGLAITRKLVELQGGHLTLESQPGRGSTFAFQLRLKTPSAELRLQS